MVVAVAGRGVGASHEVATRTGEGVDKKLLAGGKRARPGPRGDDALDVQAGGLPGPAPGELASRWEQSGEKETEAGVSRPGHNLSLTDTDLDLPL